MTIDVVRTVGTDTALRDLAFERLHLSLEITFASVEVIDITNRVDFFFMLGDVLPGILQLDLEKKDRHRTKFEQTWSTDSSGIKTLLNFLPVSLCMFYIFHFRL